MNELPAMIATIRDPLNLNRIRLFFHPILLIRCGLDYLFTLPEYDAEMPLARLLTGISRRLPHAFTYVYLQLYTTSTRSYIECNDYREVLLH